MFVSLGFQKPAYIHRKWKRRNFKALYHERNRANPTSEIRRRFRQSDHDFERFRRRTFIAYYGRQVPDQSKNSARSGLSSSEYFPVKPDSRSAAKSCSTYRKSPQEEIRLQTLKSAARKHLKLCARFLNALDVRSMKSLNSLLK